MKQEKDSLAVLLAYVFACQIRQHPMPMERQRRLMEQVRQWLEAEQEGETQDGKECADRAGAEGTARGSDGYE